MIAPSAPDAAAGKQRIIALLQSWIASLRSLHPHGPWIVGILALLILWRFFVAAVMLPANDELYYATWSQHLRWGYYDHPPMIAYWIAAGRFIFGDTLFGLRVAMVTATTVGSLFLYDAYRLLFDTHQRALTCVFWINATLAFNAASVLSTPDTPLIVMTMIGFWAVVRLWKSSNGWWWYVIGACGGLALLSKQTALLWGGSVFLFICCVRANWIWLRCREMYLGAAVAFLIFLPNVLWNASHGWVNVKKQGVYRLEGISAFEPSPHFVLRLFLGEMGIITPIVFLFCVSGLFLGCYQCFYKRDPRWSLLTCLTLPTLLFFLWYGFFMRVQENWLITILPSFVIAGSESFHLIMTSAVWRPYRKVLRFAAAAAVPLGLLITGVVFLQAVTNVLPIRSNIDDARGWDESTRYIMNAGRLHHAQYIITSRYGDAAQILWYRRPEDAPTYQYTQRVRYQDWGQRLPESARGLYVSTHKSKDGLPPRVPFEPAEKVRGCHKGMQRIAVFDVVEGSRVLRAHGLYVFESSTPGPLCPPFFEK